jgi:tetratricopeptide (TPR) repeat protein
MSSIRLQQLQELQKATPDDPFLDFAIAKEYEKLEANDKALETYQQLVTVHPDYVGTYYHMAKLYEKLGQAPEAWQTYSKGMKIAQQQKDQHAFNELAGARLLLGDEEDFEDI